MAEALDILAAIRMETEAAVDVILAAATGSLADLSAIRDGLADGADRVEQRLLQILEACAFQDIVGQRLARLETLLGAPTASAVDPLLNGPGLDGQGLDQLAADRLLSGLQSPASAR